MRPIDDPAAGALFHEKAHFPPISLGPLDWGLRWVAAEFPTSRRKDAGILGLLGSWSGPLVDHLGKP